MGLSSAIQARWSSRCDGGISRFQHWRVPGTYSAVSSCVSRAHAPPRLPCTVCVCATRCSAVASRAAHEWVRICLGHHTRGRADARVGLPAARLPPVAVCIDDAHASACACAHTCTSRYTCMHARTQTCMHVHICTHARTHMHAHTRKRARARPPNTNTYAQLIVICDEQYRAACTKRPNSGDAANNASSINDDENKRIRDENKRVRNEYKAILKMVRAQTCAFLVIKRCAHARACAIKLYVRACMCHQAVCARVHARNVHGVANACADRARIQARRQHCLLPLSPGSAACSKVTQSTETNPTTAADVCDQQPQRLARSCAPGAARQAQGRAAQPAQVRGCCAACVSCVPCCAAPLCLAQHTCGMAARVLPHARALRILRCGTRGTRGTCPNDTAAFTAACP